MPNLFLEIGLLLVGSPRFFEPERHLHITEGSEGGNQCGGGLVCLSMTDLVITRVGGQKA
jgi:hypothetical protein